MVARAPEKFLQVLRRLGIMKNINVLVGHAALLIVDDDKFIYTDFGRYITPKGYGRARSAKTDPKLEIRTKPKWSEDGELTNLEEVFSEMEGKKNATHGENELYASLMYNVDISKAKEYINQIQEMGYIPYSGLKKKDSNCARFITNIILASVDKKSRIYKRLSRPVTIAPTPFFNVLAGNDEGNYFVYYQGKLNVHQDNYKFSRKDVLNKLSYSFRKSKAKLLPSDIQEGQIAEPSTKPDIKNNVTYLGGIGEGAWYSIDKLDGQVLQVSRYYRNGKYEYTNSFELDADWSESIRKEEATIIHDSHFAWVTLFNKLTKNRRRFYAVKHGGN